MPLSRRDLLAVAALSPLGLAGCAAAGTPAVSSGPGGVPTSAASSPAGSATAARVSAADPSAPVSRGSVGAEKLTVGLTYIPNVQFAPFYVAERRGLFTAAGVAATLRHHGAQEGLFTALVAGQEHVVIAGADEMLQARAQGADLVAIAPYYQRYPVALIVGESSPIRRPADVRGKRIGVPGRYGETWFGLKVLLQQAGLTERDVTVTEIGYTQQAALSSGKVDAIMGFVNNDLIAFSAAGFPARAVPLAAGDLPLVSICLVTTERVLRDRREAARRVAQALGVAIDAVVTDPAAALTDSLAYVPALASDATARSAADRTLRATVELFRDASGTRPTALDSGRFAAMSSFLEGQGLLAKPVDAAAAMRNVTSA